MNYYIAGVDIGGTFTDTVIASPALGDVDSDGLLEVVVGSHDGTVRAWNGDGSIAWSAKPTFDHPKLASHPRNGNIGTKVTTF